jgi:hypothetical protein
MTSYLKNGWRHEQVKWLKISTIRNKNWPLSVFFTNVIIFENTDLFHTVRFFWKKNWVSHPHKNVFQFILQVHYHKLQWWTLNYYLFLSWSALTTFSIWQSIATTHKLVWTKYRIRKINMYIFHKFSRYGGSKLDYSENTIDVHFTPDWLHVHNTNQESKEAIPMIDVLLMQNRANSG